jgi:hypothetical protein
MSGYFPVPGQLLKIPPKYNIVPNFFDFQTSRTPFERSLIAGREVILPEESSYIAGRAWLYNWKSAVILPEESSYIAGRARLYCWKSAVILLEERIYIAGRARSYFAIQKMAYLSCSAGCTHFAWIKNLGYLPSLLTVCVVVFGFCFYHCTIVVRK